MGGVQVCTHEYIEVIRATGVDLEFCTFDADRRLSTRVMRRFNTSHHFRPAEPNLEKRLAEQITRAQPDYLFLNQSNTAGLAAKIRPHLPKGSKIVLLSHGLESTDLLNVVRTSRWLPIQPQVRPTAASAIGHELLCESIFRRDIDLVLVLSPSDIVLEQWVGAQRAAWLPRVVANRPLDWQPPGNRIGYLGTLDHSPNLEGLVDVLKELEKHDIGTLRVRVVGRPQEIGRWLRNRFRSVDYLGSLDDSALGKEASSWNAMIHPQFCCARGCSTKLATGIGWQIPIVTTELGCRGYEWKNGRFVVAATPGDFAEKSLGLLDLEAATAARKQIVELALSSPTIPMVALRLREILNGL
jgi:hypothetical protein